MYIGGAVTVAGGGGGRGGERARGGGGGGRGGATLSRCLGSVTSNAIVSEHGELRTASTTS